MCGRPGVVDRSMYTIRCPLGRGEVDGVGVAVAEEPEPHAANTTNAITVSRGLCSIVPFLSWNRAPQRLDLTRPTGESRSTVSKREKIPGRGQGTGCHVGRSVPYVLRSRGSLPSALMTQRSPAPTAIWVASGDQAGPPHDNMQQPGLSKILTRCDPSGSISH